MRCFLFTDIYRSFPNPLVWVALINTITLLSLGLFLGIDIWPSKFSRSDRCDESVVFYSFPFLILIGGAAWFIYLIMSSRSTSLSINQDHRDHRGVWQTPIGFIITSLSTSILMILSSTIAMRGWEGCQKVGLIGAWPTATFLILIMGGISLAIPMLYMVKREEIACRIRMKRLHYWIGIYPLCFEMIFVWVAVVCSWLGWCVAQHDNVNNNQDRNDDLLFWEDLAASGDYYA